MSLGSQNPAQRWLPSRKDISPAWALAAVSALVGVVTFVTGLDQIGLTRSALCGPKCDDAPIEAALSASTDEFVGRYRAARQASMRQLKDSPFDTGAWLRLSLLELKAGHGRMTDAAQDAFGMSYERAPVDATVARWRIPLAFDHLGGAHPERSAGCN